MFCICLALLVRGKVNMQPQVLAPRLSQMIFCMAIYTPLKTCICSYQINFPDSPSRLSLSDIFLMLRSTVFFDRTKSIIVYTLKRLLLNTFLLLVCSLLAYNLGVHVRYCLKNPTFYCNRQIKILVYDLNIIYLHATLHWKPFPNRINSTVHSQVVRVNDVHSI